MKIVEIKQEHRLKWDDFLRKNSYSSLLQSWEWGEVTESLGQKTFKLAIIYKEKIIGTVLIVKHKLPFGKSYLYCPMGPLLDWSNSKETIGQLKLLLYKIKEIAKKEKAIFVRIDPSINKQMTNNNLQQIKNLGFKKGQRDIQPKDTLILDISLPKEEILAQMKSKTRYNIRLALKKKVKIKQSIDLKDVEIFWQLAHQTSERDAFFCHPKEHYQKMIEILGPKKIAKLFIAYYKDKPLACNIVTFFKDTACYSHGTSSSEHRNLMAPYLVQWESILDAKKQGYKYYDFWGISDEISSWAGITRFKKGFAPHIAKTSYIGSWDMSYSKFWYFLFNLTHRIRGK